MLAQVSPRVVASPSSQATVLAACKQPLAGSQEWSLHTLPSSQSGGTPPTQLPAAQVSAVVQALPSSQGSELSLLVQPVTVLQPSSVQPLPSSQSGGSPPKQSPSEQVSAVVQALPSSQLIDTLTLSQPVGDTQESAVHWSPSSQAGAGPPTQVPAEQLSAVVQASPSSQARVLASLRQPVPGSQLSSVHPLPSSQSTDSPDRQAPAEQVSPAVQALPSSQAAVLFVLTQPAEGSQVSSVHTSASSQSAAAPPTQAPPEQVSAVVQALPSSQGNDTSSFTQPAKASQLSSVQGLESLQSRGMLPRQLPSQQESTVVQTLPSSQARVLGWLLQPTPARQSSSVQPLLSSQTTRGSSSMQVAEQQSPSVLLPSSHCSPRSSTPLPHTSIMRPSTLNSSVRKSPTGSGPLTLKWLSPQGLPATRCATTGLPTKPGAGARLGSGSSKTRKGPTRLLLMPANEARLPGGPTRNPCTSSITTVPSEAAVTSSLPKGCLKSYSPPGTSPEAVTRITASANCLPSTGRPPSSAVRRPMTSVAVAPEVDVAVASARHHQALDGQLPGKEAAAEGSGSSEPAT